MDSYSQMRRSYDTDMLILRTLFALDPNTNLPISTNFIVTTDGIGGLVWMSPFQNLSTAGPGVGYLPSTIYVFDSNISSISSTVSTINVNYQAGLSSLSTVLGLSYISTGIYTNQLNSTVTGLGSLGYVSTLSLLSTVQWLTDASRYISTGNLLSTTAGFASNTQIASTLQGLGTLGYISTPQLLSTVSGLGSIGYVSTSYLQSTIFGLSTTTWNTIQSTVNALGTSGFVSTSQLTSTVQGLGSSGYISTSQLVSTVASIYSPATYVSTGALMSTTAGLSTNFGAAIYIDNAGNITINGGTVIISSVENVVYLSSFVFSTLTYEGANGTIKATYYDGNPPKSMIFSTASIRLDQFSSYITAKSRLYIDYYPSFVFSGIYQGAASYFVTPMSTLLQYGSSDYLLSNVATTWVYGNNTSNAFGNMYQQPIKIQIPGSQIASNYLNPYFLCHNMENSLTYGTTNGFKNCNIDVFVGSTNSVFLSIQNLP